MTFSRYYRYKLPQSQKKIYDDIVAGIEKRATQVHTSYISINELSLIFQAVNYDYPKFYYVDFYKVSSIQTILGSTVFISYLIDEALQRKIDQKIKIVTNNILKNVVGKSMNSSALFLHDWLVSNCTYEEYNNIPYAAHSIVGPFINSKCVCEGYSKAYKYLADCIKLRSIVVIGEGIHPDGTSGRHAWNIIMLNKQCFHVDVTFDLLFAGKYCSRAYYLLTTKEILYNHTISPNFAMPDCSVHSHILPVVSGTNELIDFLNSQYKSGVSHSEVRLTKGFPKQELLAMIKRKMTVKDIGWYSHIDRFWYGNKNRTLFVCWK